MNIILVTGDESWVSFVNAEIKEPSKQWIHAFTIQGKKICTNVCIHFLDSKGVVMVEFMQRGTTVMSEVYCKTTA
jgi:hypothetical protein